MDLNQIDMAMKAYASKLSESEQERLRFFRTLWGVQAEVQKEHGAKVEHAVPDADTLKQADAAQRLAGAMAVFEQFDHATRDALAGVRWDRLVAASDMKLAGSDPSAYVEAFAGLLQDDGLGEDAARMGASVISLALRALLEPIAQEVQAARVDGNADQPYPVHCPVCGCEASVAHVGQAGTKTKGRGRALWCAQCGCVWDIERVRCARCGTQNQGHLHFFNVEGDDDHRIATCDECGGYVRTVYEEDGPLAQLYPFSYEVEDVVMAKLDLIAYRQLVAQEAQQD